MFIDGYIQIQNPGIRPRPKDGESLQRPRQGRLGARQRDAHRPEGRRVYRHDARIWWGREQWEVREDCGVFQEDIIETASSSVNTTT